MSKLGKGLSALIPEKKFPVNSSTADEGSKDNRVVEVDINLVVPNTEQPRQSFDDEKLRELSNSIKKHGVLQPLIVKKRDGDFELIAGERRLRASKIAGLSKIPVIFKEDLSQEQQLELALIENIQREDLNVVEEAEAYKRLIEMHDLTQEDIAKQTGKSRSTIANKLRILNLPDEVIQGLRLKKLTEGHARALLPIKEPQKLLIAYRKLLDNNSSVRTAENRGSDGSDREANIDSEIKKLQNDLEERLATRVQVQDKAGRGKISINYFSKDELRDIVTKIIGSSS